MKNNVRPRYGLIISTSNKENELKNNLIIDDKQWKQICEKVTKYNWCYEWNQAHPPSWTAKSLQVKESTQPTTYDANSNQIADIIHNLLDALPEYGSLGYLLDILWITDNVPDDIVDPINSLKTDSNQGLSVALYGALKRSYDWHGANINIIYTATINTLSENSLIISNDVIDDNFLQTEVGAKIFTLQTFINKTECFSSCKSKCSSDRLVWRGSLGLYEESDNSFTLRRMRGFQLFAKDGKSLEIIGILHNCSSEEKNENLLMSRTLKVISTCDVNSVPVYLLSNQHFYLTVNETEEVHEEFLSPEGEFFGGYSGIIVKLDCVSVALNQTWKSTSSKLTLEFWKQYITKSQSYLESIDQSDMFESQHEHSIFSSFSDQSGSESSEQNVQSLHFLVMNDNSGGIKCGEPFDNGRNTKICILLDPSAAEGGGQLKSFNKVQDTLSMKFNREEELNEEKLKVEQRLQELSIATEYNAPKLYTFIRQVQSAVLAMIYTNEGSESEYLSKDRFQSTLDAIQMRILRKINAFSEDKNISSELCNIATSVKNDPIPNTNMEDDSLWEEKRFISFIERLKRQTKENNLPTSDDSTMKPNEGEFVILEAKEMLKLFTKDGLAKYPEKCEEIKVPQKLVRKGFNWDKEAEKYPELLLCDYPDLSFNRNEKSEEMDRERSKLQLMYVGSKETASTCHVQNSSKGPPPVVVTKRREQIKTGVKVDSAQNPAVQNSEPSTNKYEIKNKKKTHGSNITQLRRSPRKKVSTASIVSRNAFRSGVQTPGINIGAGDAGSTYSGDTNSIISNRRSLPGSTYRYPQKEFDDKSNTDGKRESRATRSSRILGNAANIANESKGLNSSIVMSGGNSEDNFKQKLRNAVYDALKGKDICENNKLFKPCFKKLFDICMMYGKELAKKNTRGSSGTRQLLNKIAEQNVDSVINIEKTLFGE